MELLRTHSFNKYCAVAQKCSLAEAKRKQKIAELNNSPAKNRNLHQIKDKLLWFLSFKSLLKSWSDSLQNSI